MVWLPPKIYGPLLPLSELVRLDPVIPGAIVNIFVDGQRTNSGPLQQDRWMAIGTPLAAGQVVTASVTLDGTEGPPTPQGVVVDQPPLALPAPEAVSAINQYSSIVLVDRLAPGAQVTITSQAGGEVFAEERAQRGTQFFRLKPELQIRDANRLAIRQSYGDLTSEQGLSPELTNVDEIVKTKQLPVVTVAEPLNACATSVHFQGAPPDYDGAVPGFETRIDNGDYATTWLSNAGAYGVHDSHPLKEGPYKVIQFSDRLGIESEPATGEVQPPYTPYAPRHANGYCPEIGMVSVSAPPGSIITVFAIANGNRVEIGSQVAYEWMGDYAVPSDLLPPGTTGLVFGCSLCGAVSDLSEPMAIGAIPRSVNARIVAPVLTCVRHVIVRDVAPGSRLRVYDDMRRPLSNHHYAATEFAVVHLYPHIALVEGLKLVVEIEGCSPDPVTLTAGVEAIPRGGTSPTILQILPSARAIAVKDCLLCARLDIYRDGQFLCFGHAFSEPASIGLPPGVFAAEGEVFEVVQRLCGHEWRSHGRSVERGRMAATFQPPALYAGEVNRVRYSVVDAETGARLDNCLFRPDGINDAYPNDWDFNLPAPANSGAVTGKVTLDYRYHDAVVSLPAAPRPAPSAAALTIEVGPDQFVQIPGSLGAATVNGSFTIDSVKVTVIADGQAAADYPMTASGGGFRIGHTFAAGFSGGFSLKFEVIASYDFNLDYTFGYQAQGERHLIDKVLVMGPQGNQYMPMTFAWPAENAVLNFEIFPTPEPAEPGTITNKVFLDMLFRAGFG